MVRKFALWNHKNKNEALHSCWEDFSPLTQRSCLDVQPVSRVSDEGFLAHHFTSILTLWFPRKKDSGLLCSPDFTLTLSSTALLWSEPIKALLPLNPVKTLPFFLGWDVPWFFWFVVSLIGKKKSVNVIFQTIAFSASSLWLIGLEHMKMVMGIIFTWEDCSLYIVFFNAKLFLS